VIDPETYRRSILRDTASIVAVTGDLDVAVPSCPGWTIGRLVSHLGKVQRWADRCLLGEDEALGRPDGPGDADVGPWLADGAETVVATLESVDLDAPVNTWSGPQPARWWLRRLAQETAVHRWDAQDAAGTADGFDPVLAVDGIDEFFEEFVPVLVDATKITGEPTSIHLHATDIEGDDGEWFVELAPGEVRWERVHRKGDLAVRAPASDLLLVVWGRRGLDGLESFGDEDALTTWRAVAAV
jgi:uncharacterized protein (TIGR03083 family)